VTDLAVTSSPAASAAGEDYPLVQIVRTLVDLDASPAELEDAARCAGPEEIAFALEILRQQIAKAEERLDEIDVRFDELCLSRNGYRRN
jgi:hypothetical protein